MIKLKLSEVVHVAKLANLNLTKKEEKLFTKQLSDVVGYIEELKKVDTKGVKPTSQTTGLENTTRKDLIKENNSLGQKSALSGAKFTHNGYFVVDYLLKERSLE
jgi:aspartyl-tRNA(Asn)/glutamyl-tRNA(Gln) amidotransferase subunit C